MSIFSKLFRAENNDRQSILGHFIATVGGFLLFLPTVPGGQELITQTIGSLNPKTQALISLFLLYIGAAKAGQVPEAPKPS